MDDRRHAFLERLFVEHRHWLLAWFLSRIRVRSDAPDLVQEVYARLLKVKDTEAIGNPEGYLYTVASNLLKEYGARQRSEVNLPHLDECSVHKLLGELPPLDGELEENQIIELLESVIKHLPRKIFTAMILKYQDGLTYQQIAERMEVSPSTVKKYLRMGIAHCRTDVGTRL